jgi:hypothetical protein
MLLLDLLKSFPAPLRGLGALSVSDSKTFPKIAQRGTKNNREERFTRSVRSHLDCVHPTAGTALPPELENKQQEDELVEGEPTNLFERGLPEGSFTK